MTLDAARRAERRRRMGSLPAALAFAIAGLACAGAGGGAVILGQRELVRWHYGFDTFVPSHWNRLAQLWTSGRFALDEPRKIGFAAAIVGGAGLGIAVAGLSGFRLPGATVRLVRAWRARDQAPPVVPPAPRPGAQVPAPQTGEAATPSSPADLVRGIEADPEAAAKLRQSLDAATKIFADARDRIREEAEADLRALVDAETSLDAAADAGALAADTRKAARKAGLRHIRQKAAEFDAAIFEGKPFGVDLALLAGRTLALVVLVAEPGAWSADERADPAEWASETAGRMRSPAYDLANRVVTASEILKARASAHAFAVRGLLCLAGEMQIVEIDEDTWAHAYRVDVADASPDGNAGVDGVETALRTYADAGARSEAATEALVAFAAAGGLA